MADEDAAVNAAPKTKRGEECLNLRVGQPMRASLQALADEQGVSVNAYCKTLLDHVLNDPNRGRVLALRTLAEIRKQVDRVRDAGVLSDGTLEALLETVEGAVREANHEEPNPAPEPQPKKRSWRFPVPTLLSGLFESEDNRE